MGALGPSNTAATCLLVWSTYEALQRRHSVKWCAVAWGQRFLNLAVLVGLVNFVIVKGTHVNLVLGENVKKEGSCEHGRGARTTEEITRRCQKARGVYGALRAVWQRRNINDRVKGRLFEAFVSSVLLNNAEVWSLRPEELTRLQWAYTDMVIQLARKGEASGAGEDEADGCTCGNGAA
jgi:hypothetical protein